MEVAADQKAVDCLQEAEEDVHQPLVDKQPVADQCAPGISHSHQDEHLFS